MKWTDEEIKTLEEKYPTLGPKKILPFLPNRNLTQIKDKVKYEDIRFRQPRATFNENYFSENWRNKEVIAGFIASDGCINTPKIGQKRLIISQHPRDGDALEFIKQQLKFTGTIKTYKNNNSSLSCLTICSDKLCLDLLRYNITPRKSLILDFPTFYEDEEIIKFVAGVFGGDGHARDYNGYPIFQIASGSKNFLLDLSLVVLLLIDYEGDKTFVTGKKNRWQFRLGGKKAEAWIKLMWQTNFHKFPKRKWDKIEYLR